MLVLVCAHNTLFSLMFSSHLRVHWKKGCLSSGCYNKNMITGRLKQPMFIFSVLEVGSPRSSCLQMWSGEGSYPDLQMAVFLLGMSSHSGGQREGMVLFSCRCEGHHEGSTFMTWRDYLPEVLSPKPVTLGVRVSAYEFEGHAIVQSIAKSLRLSFAYREFTGKYPVREGERENGKQGWAEEMMELWQRLWPIAQSALELGWPFREFWDEARNWPPRWPVTGYRPAWEGSSLGQGSSLWPRAVARQNLSCKLMCCRGLGGVVQRPLHRTVRGSEHLTSILTSVHHPGPTWVVCNCRIAFLMVLAPPSGRA